MKVFGATNWNNNNERFGVGGHRMEIAAMEIPSNCELVWNISQIT